LAKKQQFHASAIAKEPLIAAPLEMEPGFWGNLVSVNPSSQPFNIVHRAPDAITVLTLVAAKVGIGVVSGSLSQIVIPGIIYRDIVRVVPASGFWLSCTDETASRIVSAF
jgi:hypothetical protein